MCVKPQLLIFMRDQTVSRYQIPGENQILEPRILLQSLYSGDSLITFTGNLPDSAFSGNARHIRGELLIR